jgi:transcriptional regulator with XRE-family HTH domain
VERDQNGLRKLGALVRRERKAARCSQEEFEKVTGISIRNLSSIENGVRVGRGAYSLLETHFQWDPGSAITGEPTRNGRPAAQPPPEPTDIQVGDILDWLDSVKKDGQIDEDEWRFMRARVRKIGGLVPDPPP